MKTFIKYFIICCVSISTAAIYSNFGREASLMYLISTFFIVLSQYFYYEVFTTSHNTIIQNLRDKLDQEKIGESALIPSPEGGNQVPTVFPDENSPSDEVEEGMLNITVLEGEEEVNNAESVKDKDLAELEEALKAVQRG